jgi:hypothetical protein
MAAGMLISIGLLALVFPYERRLRAEKLRRLDAPRA